jgi:hypothetical protein
LNEWVRLVAVHPETGQLYAFQEGRFLPYQPLAQQPGAVSNLSSLIETHRENLPVLVMSNA